jgi:hypothetical protein
LSLATVLSKQKRELFLFIGLEHGRGGKKNVVGIAVLQVRVVAFDQHHKGKELLGTVHKLISQP